MNDKLRQALRIGGIGSSNPLEKKANETLTAEVHTTLMLIGSPTSKGRTVVQGEERRTDLFQYRNISGAPTVDVPVHHSYGGIPKSLYRKMSAE